MEIVENILSDWLTNFIFIFTEILSPVLASKREDLYFWVIIFIIKDRIVFKIVQCKAVHKEVTL